MGQPSICILGEPGSRAIFRVPTDVIEDDGGSKYQWDYLANYGTTDYPTWKHHYKPLEGLDVDVVPQEQHQPPHVYDDLPWPFLPYEA